MKNIQKAKLPLFLRHIQVHPSWEKFFNREDVQEELKSIEGKIGNNFTPKAEHVLRFATNDLQNAKIIWLGRDPYPQPNTATGRCFEVNGIESWFDKEANLSLKNIVKLIHKSYNNRIVSASIQEVRKDIQNGSFPILPPNQAFSHWEKEGVLFLNQSFTCRVGDFSQAGSHEKLWKPFFLMLLAFITKKNKEIRYFLWGKARDWEEQLLQNGVPVELIYKSKHPSTNGDKGKEEGYVEGYKRNTDFQNNPCFKETMNLIKWV